MTNNFYFSHRRIENDEKLSIMIDGRHYFINKEDCNEESFAQILNLCRDLKNNKVGDVNNVKIMLHQLSTYGEIIANVEDFEYINERFSLSNTLYPVPVHLMKRLSEASKNENDEDVKSLKAFWELSLLNPSDKAKQDFYLYTENFIAPITKHGYVIMYKAVRKHKSKRTFSGEDLIAYDNEVNKNLQLLMIDNPELKEDTLLSIATQETNKMLFVLNNKSETICVDDTVKNREFYTVLGTGAEIEEFNINGTYYSPIHTGGEYGNYIKLGTPVTMPRTKVDDNEEVDCSQGLHVGAYEYVKHFASDDNSILMCLVNPKNVVAIPKYDTSKIRVSEYIPIAEIERQSDGSWKQLESYFSEIDYINYEKDLIEKELKKKTIQENYTSESGLELDKDYIKEILKKRTQLCNDGLDIN